MDLLPIVESTILHEKLLQPGEKVVVAVSGGPDSVALLKLLTELAGDWELQLIAAHVNHRFRGRESEQEAEFVERLAAAWGVPCAVAHIDVPRYMAEEALNAQVAARQLRYAFLVETAAQFGAAKIALAHHADDQAETVLMRLLKGTGPSGLGGMAFTRLEQDVQLIRPLLRITKQEILAYCRARGLDYVTDSSNLERKYFRNQVRLDVIPVLTKYNPRLTEAVNRLAETIRAEDDYVQQAAAAAMGDIVSRTEAGFAFTRQSFISLHLALQRRLIKLILSYLSARLEADFAKIELIRSAVVQKQPPSLMLQLAEDAFLVREYDRIMLTDRRPAAAGAYEIAADRFPFAAAIPGTAMQLTMDVTDWIGGAEPPLPVSKWEAFFDADELPLPLIVRNRRAGDRMQVEGLNGTKKVKDMFIDAKVAGSQRDVLPLVADAAGRILWIPGLRRSAHGKISEHTKRVLHMKYFGNIK